MNKTISQIQELLAKALNAMPGVFSTVQWGGRAYKLPGPGTRGKKKPVLLTHVCMNKAGDAVCLGFRLEKPRAKAVIRQYDWINVNSFGSLGRNGWVEMAITTKAQCKVTIALLRESRMLHPMPEETAKQESKARRGKRAAGGDDDVEDQGVARRIDAVVRRKRDEGWRPDRDA